MRNSNLKMSTTRSHDHGCFDILTELSVWSHHVWSQVNVILFLTKFVEKKRSHLPHFDDLSDVVVGADVWRTPDVVFVATSGWRSGSTLDDDDVTIVDAAGNDLASEERLVFVVEQVFNGAVGRNRVFFMFKIKLIIKLNHLFKEFRNAENTLNTLAT